MSQLAARRSQLATPRPIPPLAVSIALCLVPLLWPGDAPFIFDEPKLLESALDANANRALAVRGLPGTRGVHYGPLPVWFFQAMLLVSHDPVALVALRAALVTASVAVALLWLSRSLGLWPWFIPVVLLSPYLWFYNRLLWDNSFCIPWSALLLAAYAAHLRTGSRAALRLALALLAALPFVHLMSAAIVLAVGLHLVCFRRRELWSCKFSALAILAAIVGLHAPYLAELLRSRPTAGKPEQGLAGWVFPLLGGRFLTGTGLEYFFGPQWWTALGRSAAPFLRAAVVVSGAAHLLVWAGMLVAFAWARPILRRSKDARGSIDPRAHLALIALSTWAAQTVLNGLTRTFHHPHYYNATWIAHVLFAWLALDALARPALRPLRPAALIAAVHAATLALVLCFLILRVHRLGGTRTLRYGPTLRNQIDVAATVNRYAPDAELRTEVPRFQKLPQALRVLRRLYPSDSPPLPPTTLLIRHVSPDPFDGRVEVIPAPSGGSGAPTPSAVDERGDSSRLASDS